MSGLTAQLYDGVSWNDAGAVLDNSVGTPVDSATANNDGRAIADIFTLTFASVIAATSATVKVATGSSVNPYADAVGVSVLLDGATIYSNIIPGVDLVFSDSGSFTASWAATITVGQPFGVRNSFPPDAGTESDEIQVRVHNSGADTGSDCKARLLPVLKAVKITGSVFARLRTFAESATEKLTGAQVSPYAVTVSGVTGSGGSKTMDVAIDGDPFNVENLTDSTTTDSTGLNVNDFYRATDGPLEDMEFKLSQAAVNSDKVNVLCFSQRFSQIAEDVGGGPGIWGTADVQLTESGQADGDITADGVAYFWLRVLVPSSANSASNPYLIDVAISGSALNSAGWTS